MKAMRHFLLLTVVGLGATAFVDVQEARAQRHTNFDARLTTDDRGRPIFRVRPHVSNGRMRDTSEWGIYGVLMCFRRNGRPIAERKDMTYDLVNDGEYRFTLAYSTDARITDFEYEFFDATQPPSTYPSKESCH